MTANAPIDFGHAAPGPQILAAEALRQLRRLTDDLRRPPLAALPLEHGEAGRELRLFEAVFARDSLRVALALATPFPELGRATLLHLAAAQGIGHDASREEEPGRVAHELRDPEADPVARDLTARHGWGWPYYGAVDSTPLFVLLLAELCRQTGRGILAASYRGRDGRARTLAEAHRAAVRWIAGRMDENPEGLIESRSPLPEGIRNQVWKDSRIAYHHAGGDLADERRGVASIEVQALAHDALVESAALLRWYGDDQRRLAGECEARAAALRAVVENTFWVEDKHGPYVALGSDRDPAGRLRPLRVRSSNMGHLLASRMLDGDDGADRAGVIARALGRRDLTAAAGIRTLSSGAVRYRPGGYHVGSVWPWENELIARGLRRFRHDEQAEAIERGVLDSCALTGMFPEFVRGEADRIAANTEIVDVVEPGIGPDRAEQPPQQVQAWTVAGVLAIADRQARRLAAAA
jgi:glycogen debranching enzyme